MSNLTLSALDFAKAAASCKSAIEKLMPLTKRTPIYNQAGEHVTDAIEFMPPAPKKDSIFLGGDLVGKKVILPPAAGKTVEYITADMGVDYSATQAAMAIEAQLLKEIDKSVVIPHDLLKQASNRNTAAETKALLGAQSSAMSKPLSINEQARQLARIIASATNGKSLVCDKCKKIIPLSACSASLDNDSDSFIVNAHCHGEGETFIVAYSDYFKLETITPIDNVIFRQPLTGPILGGVKINEPEPVARQGVCERAISLEGDF